MTPAEVAQWAAERRVALADFTSHAQAYINKRNWPGSEHNPTNQRYNEFFKEAADLLAALDELYELAEQFDQGDKDV
jgi:hypothetical protein